MRRVQYSPLDFAPSVIISVMHERMRCFKLFFFFFKAQNFFTCTKNTEVINEYSETKQTNKQTDTSYTTPSTTGGLMGMRLIHIVAFPNLTCFNWFIVFPFFRISMAQPKDAARQRISPSLLRPWIWEFGHKYNPNFDLGMGD